MRTIEKDIVYISIIQTVNTKTPCDIRGKARIKGFVVGKAIADR